MRKQPLQDTLAFVHRLLQTKDEALAEHVAKVIAEEQAKPLTAAILGPTGSGKSTLLSRVTGADFPISHTAPCTREPQVFDQVMQLAGRSQLMRYCDLPGISESGAADQRHLEKYLEYLRLYDIALYAVPAGTRAFEYDRIVLRRLLAELNSDQERAEILGKIVLVMTKADHIVIDEPWTITITPDRRAIAIPGKQTREVLKEQARFAWWSIIAPFAEYLVNRVPAPEVEGRLSEGPLNVEGGVVEYRGVLDREAITDLGGRYPHLQAALGTLYARQSAVVCSSRFGYGLDEVLLRMFQSAKQSAVYRLSGLSGSELRYLDPGVAAGLANIRLADPSRNRLVELSVDWL
jgi:energy-coupling factor transporter ATP-binding protein EcfA2